MPKRSNDFQRLIYLVRLNLADGAKVTESKMMRDRLSKRFREVDVVIEGKVGSHPVVVAIECRDHRRVADVTWVDMMKSKHERLDTNALLLASRSEFTPEARDIAKKYNIETFTLDDVETTDIPALLGPNGSLWVKTVSVTTQKVSIRVAEVQGLQPETVATSPDNLVYAAGGTVICQVKELVDELLKSPHPREYLLKHGLEEHTWFELIWEPPSDHLGRPLFMQKLEPLVLRQIESIRIVGPCKVEVAKFGMRHGRLGTVHVAWGKAVVSGRDAMAVATITPEGEEKLSLQVAGPARLVSAP